MPRSDTHRTKIAAERRQPDTRLKVASRLLAISDERDDRVAVAADREQGISPVSR